MRTNPCERNVCELDTQGLRGQQQVPGRAETGRHGMEAPGIACPDPVAPGWAHEMGADHGRTQAQAAIEHRSVGPLRRRRPMHVSREPPRHAAAVHRKQLQAMWGQAQGQR